MPVLVPPFLDGRHDLLPVGRHVGLQLVGQPTLQHVEHQLAGLVLRQLRLRGRNTCMLADSFFEAGFTPVIDDVVIGSRLDEFTSDLRSQPLLFVLLTPRLDVVRKRDAERQEKHVFDTWKHLDQVMRDETEQTGLWLDSSDLTAEQTVDEILARAWDEGRVRPSGDRGFGC